MLKKEEVDILIKELTRINKKYIGKNIVFIDYCRRKMEDRKIEENLVVKTLTGGDLPYYAEKQVILFKKQEETRYKLIYRISSRYSLIIIVVYGEKILKVINVIKTSKSVEKLWRKKISG